MKKQNGLLMAGVLLLLTACSASTTTCNSTDEIAEIKVLLEEIKRDINTLSIPTVVPGDLDVEFDPFATDNEAPQIEGTLSDIYQAVKAVYGDDYLPNYFSTLELIESLFGIQGEDVIQAFAEQPMISMYPDTFVGIEATAEGADNIEKALRAYQEDLIQNSLQYPMNLAKVQSSEVVRIDNYVFFIMLGAIQDDMDITEEDALSFAQSEIQKAIDAIEEILKP